MRSAPVGLNTAAVPPLIIGGLGGSGTRVVTTAARLAGYWMGDDVWAYTDDAKAMSGFINRWLEPLVEFPDVSKRTNRRARRAVVRSLTQHRRHLPHPAMRWGWKNPRNMWLLPFFASVIPDFRFVHVVRDGRDMSTSDNEHFLTNHGNTFAGKGWERNKQAAQAHVWAIGNLRAADAGPRFAGGGYHLVRYEDLCLHPRETVTALFEFLDGPRSNIDAAVAAVQPSAGIGRGGHIDSYDTIIMREALARFRYEWS
jgi:hypothetical protein